MRNCNFLFITFAIESSVLRLSNDFANRDFFADGYKYLGVWLEPTLNMNEHLRRVLRKANARVKLLYRVRDSLSVFAAKAVYNSFILPTMLYSSMPAVKASDTMLKKVESVQKRALK